MFVRKDCKKTSRQFHPKILASIPTIFNYKRFSLTYFFPDATNNFVKLKDIQIFLIFKVNVACYLKFFANKIIIY